jgi:transcriptional regulator with XRE-family HTH domain
MKDGERSPRLRSIFAARVREERNLQRLSQEELAEKTGLHRTYIGSIERAERNLTIDNIERIAFALGVKPTDLLTGGAK